MHPWEAFVGVVDGLGSKQSVAATLVEMTASRKEWDVGREKATCEKSEIMEESAAVGEYEHLLHNGKGKTNDVCCGGASRRTRRRRARRSGGQRRVSWSDRVGASLGEQVGVGMNSSSGRDRKKLA